MIKQQQQEKQTARSFLWAVLCLFAAVFLFCVVFLLGDTAKTYERVKREGVQVEAYVSRLEADSDDTDYGTYVSYRYDGVLYEDVRYAAYSNSRTIGEPFTVMIDPEQPTTIVTAESPYGGAAMAAVFLMLALIGTGWFAVHTQKSAKERRTAFVSYSVINGVAGAAGAVVNLVTGGVWVISLLYVGAAAVSIWIVWLEIFSDLKNRRKKKS